MLQYSRRSRGLLNSIQGKSVRFIIHYISANLLPSAYQVRGISNVLTRACLSVNSPGGGGGIPTFQPMGGGGKNGSATYLAGE